MSTPARFMAYPLVMLSGAVVGGTFLSVHSPFNQAEASTRPQPAAIKAPEPFRGRLGAETPELHELRMAEAEMFPEGYDRDLSAPELWDQSLAGQGDPAAAASPLALRQRGGLGRLTTAPDFLKGLELPNIPIRRDPTIAKYIRYFTTSSEGRKMLTTWLRRSGRYHQLIRETLRRHELPSDIESVVYIESGFWPTARSPAGAVGLWQFMPKTARVYGLTVDKSVDERRSIWKATDAAATYLSDLYERLHSWDLALAAFNVGYNRLSSVIAEQGTDDFWTLRSIDGALPRETSLYVPKVLAIAVIVRNLKHFDLDTIEQAPALEATQIRVPPGIRLSLIARAAGTSVRKLRQLNPEIRIDATPDRGGPVEIHIPSKGLGRARVLLPRLLEDQGDDPLDMKVSPDFDWGTDEGLDKNGKGRIERGAAGNGLDKAKTSKDTAPPAEPAYDFSTLGKPSSAVDPGKTSLLAPIVPSTSLSDLGAKQVSAFSTGTSLVSQPSLVPISTPEPEPEARGVDAARVLYHVQRGDTAWSLSQVWGVPVSRIVRDNRLSNPDLIAVGQTLQLDIPAFHGTAPPKKGQ